MAKGTTCDPSASSRLRGAWPGLPIIDARRRLSYPALIAYLSHPSRRLTSTPIRNQLLSDLCHDASRCQDWDELRLEASVARSEDPWEEATARRELRCFAVGDDVPPCLFRSDRDAADDDEFSNVARADALSIRSHAPCSRRSRRPWALLVTFRDVASASGPEANVGAYVWLSCEPELYTSVAKTGPRTATAAAAAGAGVVNGTTKKSGTVLESLDRRAPTDEELHLLHDVVFLKLPLVCALMQTQRQRYVGGGGGEARVRGATTGAFYRQTVKLGSLESAWMRAIQDATSERPSTPAAASNSAAAAAVARTRALWREPCMTLRMSPARVRRLEVELRSRWTFDGLELVARRRAASTVELVLRRRQRRSREGGGRSGALGGRNGSGVPTGLAPAWAMYAACVVGVALLAFWKSAILGLCVTVASMAAYSSTVIEERILVSPNLGIQQTVVRGVAFAASNESPPWWRWRGWPWRRESSSWLLPRDDVLDVTMQEGFRCWSVVDHVVVATRSSGVGTRGKGEQLEVLFKHLCPRLPLVKKAYRLIYAALYAEPEFAHLLDALDSIHSDRHVEQRWGVETLSPASMPMVQKANSIGFSLEYVRQRGPFGVLVRDRWPDKDGGDDRDDVTGPGSRKGHGGREGPTGHDEAPNVAGDARSSKLVKREVDVYPKRRGVGAPAGWCYAHAELSLASLHVASPYRRMRARSTRAAAAGRGAGQRDGVRTAAGGGARGVGQTLVEAVALRLVSLQRQAMLRGGVAPPRRKPPDRTTARTLAGDANEFEGESREPGARASVVLPHDEGAASIVEEEEEEEDDDDDDDVAPVYGDTVLDNQGAARFFESVGMRRVRENCWMGVEYDVGAIVSELLP